MLRVLPANGAPFYVVLDEAGQVRAQGTHWTCVRVAAGKSPLVRGDLFDALN